MTVKTITDPGSLGWDYDPDTGRWTWGGNSSSGGGGGDHFPEAPVDGLQYGRQNASWTEIVGGGGGGGDDYVKLNNASPQFMDGFNNQLCWGTQGSDRGPYPAIVIGQGGGSGAGLTEAALYVETDNGSYEINNSSMYIRGGTLVGSHGSTSFGWTFIKSADFQDPNGNSIIGAPDKRISDQDIANWNAGTGGGGGADCVKLTGDQTVAGHKTWTGIATFGDTVILRGSIDGDDTANFQNAVTAGSFVKSGGTSSQYLMADGSVSTGSTGGDSGFSGDYNDLTNKPTIPTNNNQLTNGAGYITQSALGGYATTSWVGSNYQPKGSYLTASSLNGYATQTWVAQSFVPNSQMSSYYTKTEADATFELKGAGGGGDFVPLTGNSTINGTLTATDFVASSDRNKKDHIETAPTGVIEKLRGVTFRWKDSGKESSGVIAQELQDAGLGHLVHEDDNGLSVAYAGLTAYLIEEIKALKAQVEELKRD